MNSTITIGDTDEEVIDLDSSQDTINDVDKVQSKCSIVKSSLSNDVANKTDITIENAETNKDVSTSQTCNSIDTSKPLIKVMFRDENISRQYSKRIKEFIEELIPFTIKCQENDNSLSLELWDNDTDSTSQSVEITTESDDSQDIICDSLFTVDTQPKLQDDFDVPTYGKKYENVFENTKTELKPEAKDTCPPKMMCFNCLDNHNLRDCPKPRNHGAINKNKKNFNMKGGNMRSLRYHLEGDQKFGHLIPGQLSSNLRKALGLKDNELPRHIYKMRLFGYPPGWLQEAHLQHSGISLFNSDGVAEDDPHAEPGEVIAPEDRDQYDIKKIYDFPGFNTPPPPGTRDENGQYWVSPMQVAHSKQTMLKMLKGKKADDGYKRKKLKMSDNGLKDNSTLETVKMEIEDVEEGLVENVPVNGLFVPPLPQEPNVKPPEPSVPPTQVTSEDSDYPSQELQSPENSASPLSRPNSPSLCDLENMKKRLLVELQESNSPSNSDDLSKNNSADSMSKQKMPPPSNEVTPESNRTRRNTMNSSQGSIKSIDLGTPILQSTSPYNRLPSSEKFSKNICDVINFENLPDSTGKYEQMTGVLQKVRDTLAKLQ
ncbi:PREDICTED: zinc finger CCHC domain-containing protein 8 homolog isoform X2 [Dufourea novaeangliae]|uniref:Zinc finger CCHC domain-containing protein 8 like protein n=1 Tax=Dufourea novaeangliae TaxID=178035 RepID=A0A154PN82_DUFNO|nr:PREDICTED: zinc finger CCHC domain-containing protein 8 homolog isoform X2 [Dufourea novaeangliae]KZC13326.1 Zinc finger CCHC domain-containing protein 8 like protein [Dufourea novaeangliae]